MASSRLSIRPARRAPCRTCPRAIEIAQTATADDSHLDRSQQLRTPEVGALGIKRPAPSAQLGQGKGREDALELPASATIELGLVEEWIEQSPHIEASPADDEWNPSRGTRLVDPTIRLHCPGCGGETLRGLDEIDAAMRDVGLLRDARLRCSDVEVTVDLARVSDDDRDGMPASERKRDLTLSRRRRSADDGDERTLIAAQSGARARPTTDGRR